MKKAPAAHDGVDFTLKGVSRLAWKIAAHLEAYVLGNLHVRPSRKTGHRRTVLCKQPTLSWPSAESVFPFSSLVLFEGPRVNIGGAATSPCDSPSAQEVSELQLCSP